MEAKILAEFLLVFFVTTAIAGAAPENGSLSFLVVADWGGLPGFPYKTFVELAVGREMALVASNMAADFVLALGDNFYFDGVSSVEDRRFQETFESVFSAPSLQVPWLVVAGNHDHYGNVSAQVAYSARSSRWHFPDLYYKKSFRLPFSNVTLDVILIDTIVLCGNVDRHHLLRQPALRSSDRRRSEKQWEWLEAALNASRADYLVVGGHFPIYSIAEHGSTACLVQRLRPLLEKHNATAYFSGHDHNMQHIQVKDAATTMDYFVSGSANFVDPSTEHLDTIPRDSLLFHWGNFFSLGAFLAVRVTESNMTVSFVKATGSVMYQYAKAPRT